MAVEAEAEAEADAEADAPLAQSLLTAGSGSSLAARMWTRALALARRLVARKPAARSAYASYGDWSDRRAAGISSRCTCNRRRCRLQP